MKNFKILIGFSLILYVGASMAFAEPEESLIRLHRNAQAHAKECTNCHGERTDELGTDKKTKTSHALHLTSPLLKMACVNCHQSVDLQEGSAASLRKQVDSNFCARCHSAWPKAKMHTEKTKAKCTSCHASWKKKMAIDSPEVALDKVTAKDCYGCHGGRVLFAKAKSTHAGGHTHER
jgi:hypothetical protein